MQWYSEAVMLWCSGSVYQVCCAEGQEEQGGAFADAGACDSSVTAGKMQSR